ncbi:hypothetical protein [Profundibacter sp.]
MGDVTYFEMPIECRIEIIERHKFFIEQAKIRLLSQFSEVSIREEADKVMDEALKNNATKFNSEEVVESAFSDGAWRYKLLIDMRQTMLLSITASIYHEWEKQLKVWLSREIKHWVHGEAVLEGIEKATFCKILNLLKCLGSDVRSKDYYSSLDACRCVVNVYKHGNGVSLKELKNHYPEFLFDLGMGEYIGGLDVDVYDYTNLKVTKDNLEQFSHSILMFWEDIPECVKRSEIKNWPKWFRDLIPKQKL